MMDTPIPKQAKPSAKAYSLVVDLVILLKAWPSGGSQHAQALQAGAKLGAELAFRCLAKYPEAILPEGSNQTTMFDVPEDLHQSAKAMANLCEDLKTYLLGDFDEDDTGRGDFEGVEHSGGEEEESAPLSTLAGRAHAIVEEAGEISYDDLSAALGSPDDLDAVIHMLLSFFVIFREGAVDGTLEGVTLRAVEEPDYLASSIDFDAMLKAYPNLGAAYADPDPNGWDIIFTPSGEAALLHPHIVNAGADGMTWDELADTTGIAGFTSFTAEALRSLDGVYQVERTRFTDDDEPIEFSETVFFACPLEDLALDDLRLIFSAATGDDPGRKKETTIIKAIRRVEADR